MTRAGCALLLSVFWTGFAVANPLETLDGNGWHTWRVEAVEGAPAWCCFNWAGNTATSRACNLDSRSGYGSCGDGVTVNGFVQVYADLEDGSPVTLRVLAPDCPVEVEGSVTDLGAIDTDASFAWLSGLVQPGSRVSEDALATIALHRGEAPRRFLVEAAQGAAEGEIRKSAMFWLAQTGAGESEAVIRQAIANDPDHDVREEAVFALSLLPEERAVDALTAVLRDRRLQREVRENALFWLAQSESDRALAVIEGLLAGGNAGSP
jgi:hypothetical protein